MEILLRQDEIPPDLLEYFEPVDGTAMPSTWLLSPDAFSEAHFATFPRELARRCISLGTSAYGCCSEPECGAPWARVIEKPDMSKRPTRSSSAKTESTLSTHISNGWGGYPKSAGQAYQDWRNANPNKTVGWQPTCTHEAPVQPCTVLDPFSGAGTTGVVAVGLGRRYLGIELSPVYTEMSERRIAQTQPALPGLAV